MGDLIDEMKKALTAIEGMDQKYMLSWKPRYTLKGLPNGIARLEMTEPQYGYTAGYLVEDYATASAVKDQLYLSHKQKVIKQLTEKQL